jgi:hypothetical protein
VRRPIRATLFMRFLLECGPGWTWFVTPEPTGPERSGARDGPRPSEDTERSGGPQRPLRRAAARSNLTAQKPRAHHPAPTQERDPDRCRVRCSDVMSTEPVPRRAGRTVHRAPRVTIEETARGSSGVDVATPPPREGSHPRVDDRALGDPGSPRVEGVPVENAHLEMGPPLAGRCRRPPGSAHWRPIATAR